MGMVPTIGCRNLSGQMRFWCAINRWSSTDKPGISRACGDTSVQQNQGLMSFGCQTYKWLYNSTGCLHVLWHEPSFTSELGGLHVPNLVVYSASELPTRSSPSGPKVDNFCRSVTWALAESRKYPNMSTKNIYYYNIIKWLFVFIYIYITIDWNVWKFYNYLIICVYISASKKSFPQHVEIVLG